MKIECSYSRNDIFNGKENGDLTIFVPEYHYPRGYRVEFSNGDWKIDQDHQELHVNYSADPNNQILRILPI